MTAATVLAGEARTGATFARGASKQDYETPPEFIAAVEERFGQLTADLACTHENAKSPVEQFHAESGHRWPRDGVLWLNPPFSNITDWAAKCAAWRPLSGGRLLLLTPASIGTNWFADHVHGKAMVLALRPRLTFVGCEDAYPKDLMISIYGDGPGFDCWKWR